MSVINDRVSCCSSTSDDKVCWIEKYDRKSYALRRTLRTLQEVPCTPYGIRVGRKIRICLDIFHASFRTRDAARQAEARYRDDHPTSSVLWTPNRTLRFVSMQ